MTERVNVGLASLHLLGSSTASPGVLLFHQRQLSHLKNAPHFGELIWAGGGGKKVYGVTKCDVYHYILSYIHCHISVLWFVADFFFFPFVAGFPFYHTRNWLNIWYIIIYSVIKCVNGAPSITSARAHIGQPT